MRAKDPDLPSWQILPIQMPNRWRAYNSEILAKSKNAKFNTKPLEMLGEHHGTPIFPSRSVRFIGLRKGRGETGRSINFYLVPKKWPRIRDTLVTSGMAYSGGGSMIPLAKHARTRKGRRKGHRAHHAAGTLAGSSTILMVHLVPAGLCNPLQHTLQ